jgi:hypothetical protein
VGDRASGQRGTSAMSRCYYTVILARGSHGPNVVRTESALLAHWNRRVSLVESEIRKGGMPAE